MISHMKPSGKILSAIALALLFQAHAETSALWGKNGELWSASGRLPDFSYAGYHSGEVKIPNVAPGISVKDFGARGDGVADDTQAFLKAIRETKGAIEIPAGRYNISDILEIKRSGAVLRGRRHGQDDFVFHEVVAGNQTVVEQDNYRRNNFRVFLGRRLGLVERRFW